MKQNAPTETWLWRCMVTIGLTALILLAMRPAITYRALEIGLNVGWIGALAATFNLVPLVLTVPSGRWMDAGKQRSAMITSGVLITATATGFIWATNVTLLVIWSLVGGACSLVINGVCQSMIALHSPIQKYESRFAMFSLFGSAGQVAGGLLVGVMPGLLGDRLFDGSGAAAIFAATAVAAVAILVISFGLRVPERSAARAAIDADAVKPTSMSILRTPGVTPAIVASLAVLATVDLLGVYLPILGTERGWSEAAVGLLLALRGIATLLARVFMGALIRIVGSRRLFVLSVFFSALAVAAVALPVPYGVTLAFLLVAGLMLGFGQPMSMAMVARAAPDNGRGMAMSLRMSGNMVGQAMLPVLVGPLAPVLGAGAVFLAAAAALGAVSGMLVRTKSTD